MSGSAYENPLRWAEIIAVGTELLVPPRVDTNSLYITERLNDLGIEVRAKTVVADRREDLDAVLRATMKRTALVVLCGGLGPTDDDLTRDAVAQVLSRPLVEDAAVVDQIRQRFALRRVRMPENNRRQALVPAGAAVLANTHGTAPGLWIEHDGGLVVLLPGPPNELMPMFDAVVRERLSPRCGDMRVYRRVMRICGRAESDVDQAVSPVYARWPSEALPVFTTVLTAPAQVELHLSVRAASDTLAATRLEACASQLRVVLGADLFSQDGRTLEEVVGQLLLERQWRIAVAESCTGGLISSRLTDVPGSSGYVTLNAVCYSNHAKSEWLGVPAALLAEHGAVSESVAMAMARGVRQLAAVDLGLGVTGIAGPTGGSDRKPVGTVMIAAVTATSEAVRTYRFPGGRARIKQFASQMALDMARRLMQDTPIGGAFAVTTRQASR